MNVPLLLLWLTSAQLVHAFTAVPHRQSSFRNYDESRSAHLSAKGKNQPSSTDSTLPKTLAKNGKKENPKVVPVEEGKSSPKARGRKVKEATSTHPLYWRDPSDPVRFEHQDDEKCRLLSFTIRGNPLPLRRHRTAKGFVYNPSAAAQASFRRVVEEILVEQQNDILPLFGEHQSVLMSLTFCTKRPKKDFVGGRLEPDRLRPLSADSDSKRTAPTRVTPAPRTDVDNLAKFVLDSMNELLYEDDRQVVSLHATKMRDNSGTGEATHVLIKVVDDAAIEQVLEEMKKIE